MKNIKSILIGVLATTCLFLFMSFGNDHNHDYDYADKSHSHSHNHDYDYADDNHNHDYADDNHNHDYGYNSYADKNHNHDGSYYGKDWGTKTEYAEQSDLEDLENLVISLKRRISKLEDK